MDPATGTILVSLGTNLLENIFAPPQPQQQGPTQAQILAAMERQRQEEAARNAWLIGGGLVAVGLVAFLLVSRK